MGLVEVLIIAAGALCGVVSGALVLGLAFYLWKRQVSDPDTPEAPKQASPKVIKLGAAAPGAIQLERPTLPTKPDRRVKLPPREASVEENDDVTWDDGEPLTQARTLPEHVDLEELTGKVVLTSGAAVLIEDASGRREWTCPRVHADVAPSIWIDIWGPLKPEELVVFAGHYRQVERVRFEAPERLPTLLQEMGYKNVGEWFQVYYTFLKHNGVGGPGDAIADYAFGEDFKDALFAVDV